MKMLITGLVFLVCLDAAVSQVYSSYPQTTYGYLPPSDYNGGPSGGQYGDSYTDEIEQLFSKISNLYEDDEIIAETLKYLIIDNEANTNIVYAFSGRQYAEMREQQRAQIEEISELERQVEEAIQLTIDIAGLNETCREIEAQLQKIENEGREIQGDITALGEQDADQNERLAAARDALNAQSVTLDQLEAGANAASDQLAYLSEIVTQATKLVNQTTVGIFTTKVTLTSEAPTATVPAGNIFTFNSQPKIQWGISLLQIADDRESKVLNNPGYGSNKYGYSPVISNSSISYDVTVVEDSQTNQLVVRLADYSIGLVIKKIEVSILVLNLSGDLINFNY